MKDSYEMIRTVLTEEQNRRGRLIVAIDGSCAAGKTTLAGRLCADFEADLIHMDDFFLPPALRTPVRYQEPGGNVHYERFREQIAVPLLEARSGTEAAWPPLSWERFSCRTGAFEPALSCTRQKPLLIIEGCYCMRPEFQPLYDLTIFLSVPYEEQVRRIRNRNGEERLKMFEEKWIPLENRYFSCFNIAERCRIRIGSRGVSDAVYSVNFGEFSANFLQKKD